jgi:hypothetical protein
LNPYSTDIIPSQYHIGSLFVDVEQNAMIYLRGIDETTASIDKCGEFPCTGPNNVIYHFHDTAYEGTSSVKPADF